METGRKAASEEVLNLIKSKYAGKSNVQVDRTIFILGSEVLRECTACIWCNAPRIAGELLLLHAYPETDLLIWFKESCINSLSKCAACLESYYEVRSSLEVEFAKLYQPDTLSVFWRKIADFDQDRIMKPLQAFLEGTITVKDVSLLTALYEILLFPNHLFSPTLYTDFISVLSRLIASRKMIKVDRILPGIIFLAFDASNVAQKWAFSTTEDPRISHAKYFLPGSLEVNKILNRCELDSETKLKSLILAFTWIPDSIDSTSVNTVFNEILKLCDKLPSCFCIFLESLNSILARKKVTQSQVKELWEIIFRRLYSKNFLDAYLATQRSNEWLKEALQFIISTDGMSRIIQFFDYLSSYLTSAMTIEILYNCIKLISGIIMQASSVFLLKKLPHISAYRLVSLAMSLLSNQTDFSGKYPSCLVELLTRLEIHVSGDSQLSEFKGFHNLLVQICRESTDRSSTFKTMIATLGTNTEHIILFCKRNASILEEYLECEDSRQPSDHAIFMMLILFHFSPNPANVLEKLKTVFRGYPNNFTSGIFLLVKEINRPDSQIKSPEFFEKLFILIENVVISQYYLDGSPILLLYPDYGKLVETLVFVLVHLCLRYVEAVSELPTENVVKVVDILSFVCKVSNDRSIALEKSDSRSFLKLFDSLCTFASIQSFDDEKWSQVFALLLTLATLHQIALSSTSIKLFGVCLSIIKFTPTSKVKLNKSIDEYEKKLKLMMPRPPSDAPIRQSNGKHFVDLDLDLEERILTDMKSNEGKIRDRNLPISLRSSNIPIVTKPSSKMEQLKADLVRDMPQAPLPKKKAANPPPPKKLKKLEAVFSSSESESEMCADMSSVKKRFEVSAPNTDANPRSVKLIDITEKTGESNDRLQRGDNGVILSEIDLMQAFHRKILHFDLGDNEAAIANLGVTVVPGIFENADHYISVFEPLLYMEARAQLVQSNEESEMNEDLFMIVNGVCHVDDFHEVSIKDENEDELKSRFTEHDFLFVFFHSGERLPAIVYKCTNKSGVWETTMRLSVPVEQAYLEIQLREGAKLKVRKIANLVTNLREYLALHSVRSITLSSAIFQPKFNSLQQIGISTDIAALSRNLDLNNSQLRAISAVLQAINPITLIQGPPGTGKTKTIEGLVSALISKLLKGNRNSKILICAPSNAAIDEIVRRIRGGLFISENEKRNVKILRIGAFDMISDSVKDLTLEAQVDASLGGSKNSNSVAFDEHRKNMEQIKRRLNDAEKECNDAKIRSLKKSLWEVKENVRKCAKFAEDLRNNARQKILGEAQIICCTLAASGLDVLSRVDFEYVIVDEACQAVEASCLVPLQHNAKQCVLVGDPNQLPPTVISQAASVYMYEQSLFVRLQKQCPDSVLLLDTQYRMHPSISSFPNGYFYDGRLIDGPNMESLTYRPWHKAKYLGPFKFFEVTGREDNFKKNGHESRSRRNVEEARIAASLVAMICQHAEIENMGGKIGIVTPYKDQRRTIAAEISKRFGHEALSNIEISTVDGFQGQEREIIIFSCVRTENGRIGFLNDTRRLNVALTRAKCSLFVLGKTSALITNPVWRAMIEDAKSRNCYVRYDPKMWELYTRMRMIKCLRKPSIIGEADKSAILDDESKNKPVIIQSVAQRRLNEEVRKETAASTLSPPVRKPFDIDTIINRN